MSSSANTLAFVASLLLLSVVSRVDGHGFLESPRSRNWYAHQEGVASGDASKPLAEYCYHCLNTGGLTDGICGIAGGVDYTYPKSSTGSDLPWTTQAIYNEGQTITVNSVITSHHQGHFELYLCADVDNPSKDCFMQNPLEFVSDNLYNAPKDTNYPRRGYLAPNDGTAEGPGSVNVPNGWGMYFSMEFKLPEGIYGDRVLLLWKYMTGNSCRYQGYEVYPWPDGWAPDNTGACEPIPDVSGIPEQFWNCAELQILQSNPTPTAAPVPTAVPQPTDEPTSEPTAAGGCCSQNYRDCVTWGECGENQCCNDTIFLRGGADTTPGCVARWEGCTPGSSVCCGGATCMEDSGWNTCVYVANADPDPTASPVPDPTPAPYPDPTSEPNNAPVPDPTAAPFPDPTSATDMPVSSPDEEIDPNGCCSNDFKYCHPWGQCGAAGECCYDTKWMNQGADPAPCVPRWQGCGPDGDTDEPCCGGDEVACVEVGGFYTCVHKDAPTAPVPTPPTPTPPTPPTLPPVTSPVATPTASPVNPTDAPVVAPSPSTDAPTTPPVASNGCCSNDHVSCHDYGNCFPPTPGTCCGNTVWLPNGPFPHDGCIPRFNGGCTQDSDCCSGAKCVNEGYLQCIIDEDEAAPTYAPNPAPSQAPIEPTPPSPTSSPVEDPTRSPSSEVDVFETSNTASSFAALQFLESLTLEISTNPPISSLVASGGAAGSGEDVVSESQAYGVLATGVALAAMDASDSNRGAVMDLFEAYFNGWKRMCENSSAPCQGSGARYCNGGTTPCLPGWKHNAELTTEEGSGSAPDGDEDAITGMILAVKAVENDATKPSWYSTVSEWAEASASQFMYHATKRSTQNTDRRIVKLGTCWGGWEHEGNNPSYHSPAAYRLMRDYQINYGGSRNYNVPNFGDGQTMEQRWNNLIETSYDVLAAVQCPEVGLVPNWARITENGSEVESEPGSFSGSGTPQYEFGAEASRTIWRVAFDYALYPHEAGPRALAFLNPLQQKLADGFNPNPLGVPNWEDGDLSSCTQPVVDQTITVFGSWIWNAFIYAPVYSSLVAPIDGVSVGDQQDMIDAAGALLNSASVPGMSYYPRCWSVLGMLLVNGDVNKASEVLVY